jgi:hypothetical protein
MEQQRIKKEQEKKRIMREEMDQEERIKQDLDQIN